MSETKDEQLGYWMHRVDQILERKIGVTSADLDDYAPALGHSLNSCPATYR